MSILGLLPENIRRCLPREARTDASTITMPELTEKQRAKSEKLRDQIAALDANAEVRK